MEVAKVLSFESAMEARASLEGEGATEGVANSDLVLSAAVALCSLVARQVSSFVLPFSCRFILLIQFRKLFDRPA